MIGVQLVSKIASIDFDGEEMIETNDSITLFFTGSVNAKVLEEDYPDYDIASIWDADEDEF